MGLAGLLYIAADGRGMDRIGLRGGIWEGAAARAGF
jgi:hypothetical protein